MKSTAMAIISNWIQPLFEEIGTKLIGSHWDRSPIAVNAAPISLSKGPNTIYIRQEVRQLVQVSQCRRLRTVGVLATVADSTSLIDAELRDPTLLTREESYGAHIPSIEAGNVIELHHIEIRITRGFKNWRTTLWMKGFDVVAHQGLPAPQPLLRLNNDRQFQELLQSYFRFFQKPVLAPAIAAMDSPGSIRSQESVPSPSLEDSDQENSNPYSISQMQFATQAPQTLDIMSPETTHNKSKRAHASSSLLSLLGDEPPRKRRRSNQGQSTDQAADKINYTSPVGAFQSKTRKFATYNQFGRLDGSSQKLNEAEVARKLSTATTHQILQAESEPEASRKPSTDRGRQNELPQHTICAANEQTRSQQPAADEDESNRTGTTSPFRGLYESGLLMNRFLPRRLFQIPGAQKRLLDRERSWQPPKVGDRSPNGCIPPRLLKRLADAADNADDTLSPQVNVDEVGTYGHASHARDKGRDCPEELPLPERPNAVESPHRTDLVIGVEPAYKESLSDESDTSSAVGSAEWPPSSPEEKIQNLPPDSSSEASPSGRRNKTPSSGERLLPEVGDRSHSKPVLRVFSQESEAAGHGRSSGGSSEPEQEGDASLASAGMKQTLFVHTRSANDVSYDHQTTSTPAVDFQSTNLSTSTQIQVKRTPVVHNNTMLSNTYPSTSDASPSEPFTRDSNYEPITHIPGTFGSPAKHWSADDNQSSHKLPKNNDPPVVPCGSETQTNDPGHAKGDMDLYVDRGDANSGDDDLEKAEDDALSQQLSSQIQEYSSHHAQAGQKLNSPHSNYTASQQYFPLQASHNGHVLSHEQLEIDECRNMRHRTRRHPTSESSVGDGVGHEQTPTPVETHIDYSSPQGSKQISKQATSARREFFKSLKHCPGPVITPDRRDSSQHQSSRSSLNTIYSEINDSKQLTPATTVIQPRVSNKASHQIPPHFQDKFQEYCRAYPSYTGSCLDFLHTCYLLLQLQSSGERFPVCLLDDLIFRHHMEYRNYQIEQVATGHDAVPYQTYYYDSEFNIECTNRVVKPDLIRSLESSTELWCIYSAAPGMPQSPSPSGYVQPDSAKYSPTHSKLDRTSKRRDAVENRMNSSSASEDRGGTDLNGGNLSESNISPAPCLQPNRNQLSHESQSSRVESWLCQAAGHESPLLGDGSSEIDDDVSVAELETQNADISDTGNANGTPWSQHRIAEITHVTLSPPSSYAKATFTDDEVSSLDHDFDVWWRDRNTAFKEWGRAHEVVARRNEGLARLQIDARGSLRPILNSHIDIGSWRRKSID